MKRLFALALCVILVLSLAACGEPAEVPELLHPTETANALYVVKASEFETIQATGGYVMPEVEHMTLDYEVDVRKSYVELGDHVVKGQPILELNPDLEDDIKRLEIAITREQTEYDYDLQQFNKQIKDMRNMANAMGSSYDGRMMKLQIQEMQLTFDKQHRDLAARIAEEREELEEMKKQLSASTISAPCSGTIVYTGVGKEGDRIQKNMPFLSIAKDNTKLLACPFIAETDYERYTKVTAKIGDRTYDVEYIPYSEEELYSLDKSGKSYDSLFTADLPDDVSVGDYVEFEFRKTKDTPVLMVPTAALSRSGTQYSVTLLKDGSMVPAEVSVGEANLNYTEILEGLEEGDVVYYGKDLARYGKTYETQKAEYTKLTEQLTVVGAQRVALVSDPFLNEMPGEITQFFVEGYTNISVKKGDPIYEVKVKVARADQEQAKLDLKKYRDDYEEQKEKIEEKIEELTKEMKKLKSTSLEYALKELDLSDLREQLEDLNKTAEEEMEKLSVRADHFESWNDQLVKVYADQDGVISSISKYKVGDQVSENQYMFDIYDLNSYCICIESPAETSRARYGQHVTYSTTIDGVEHTYPATIASAPNVRPNPVTDKNRIYISLDDPEKYAELGPTGLMYYDEFCLSDCLLLPVSMIYHDEKEAEAPTNPQQQGPANWGGGGNWGGDWGNWGVEPVPEVTEVESFTFESDEHEAAKGKAYIWVYDENGCAVKRYVCVMRYSERNDYYWIIDGLKPGDTVLKH